MDKEQLCEWCGGKGETCSNTVYWELPDGSRAIEITATPVVTCPGWPNGISEGRGNKTN